MTIRVSLGLTLILLLPALHAFITPQPSSNLRRSVARLDDVFSSNSKLNAFNFNDDDKDGGKYEGKKVEEAGGEKPDTDFERPQVPVSPPAETASDSPPAETASDTALQDRLEAEAELAQAKARAKDTMKVLATERRSSPLSSDQTLSVVASGIGGAFLGLILGGVGALGIPDLDMLMEPFLLPIIGAITLSVAGFAGGANDGQVGEIIRGSLGSATRTTGDSIVAGIQGAVDSAVTSAQSRVVQTKTGIQGIPGKVKDAAIATIANAAGVLKKVPSKVKEAAIRRGTEVAEEIKATPGRVAERSKQLVEDAVDDTLDAVERVVDEVSAIPKRAVERVEATFSSIVGKSSSPQTPKTAQPPKTAPPGEVLRPKTPEPPRDLPPVKSQEKPVIPKFEVPKIEMPKIEVPKVNLPKPPTSKPPKKDLAADIIADVKKTQAAEMKRKEDAEKQRQESEPEQRQEAERKKKEAAQRKAEEALQRSKADVEARRLAAIKNKGTVVAAAEVKRQREEELAEKRSEQAAAAAEAKQKAEGLRRKEEERKATARMSQGQGAEGALEKATPRATISLGNLFGFGKTETSASALSGPSQTKEGACPPGVPVLYSWKQNSDGSVIGRITGSSNFKQGETITTSPVPMGATSGSVIKTSSGSRYFLDKQASFGLGGFIQGSPKPSVDTTAADAQRKQEEMRKAAEVKKKADMATAAAEAKKVAAEQRRQEAEEKKAATAAAAEARRKEAAGKKAEAAAASEARRKAVEEKQAAAAQSTAAAAAKERQKAAEEKKAAMAAAAEEKKAAAAAAAEERKAAMAAATEERRKAAEAKNAAAVAASEERRKAAATKAAVSVKKQPAAKAPPRGVPSIRSWKKRRDGGVSGRIYGSRIFSDGDFVETSPITQGALGDGSVVSTSSGSRYFLSAETATRQANIAAAIKDMTGAKPGSTITLTRERKQREAEAAMDAVKNAKPRATFSLFGLGFGAVDKDLPKQTAPRPSRPIPPKQAPRGVPTMSRWKKNLDGSVTGIISGSKTFTDGERVTTSQIAKGIFAKGEVITTGSGSRYFLS